MTPGTRTQLVALRAKLADVIHVLDQVLYLPEEPATLRPPVPDDVPTRRTLPDCED